MKKVLITISYDGTRYFGWQKQANQTTVEGELEKACSELFKNGFNLVGTSRTDRGVHALGQRATIETETTIPTDRIPDALNSKLPDDIVICDVQEVEFDFHPRYDCRQKTYEYKIVNDRYMIPQLLNYAAFERGELDLKKMKQASGYLIGEQDFNAFCASGATVVSTVRTIYAVAVEKNENIITMRFTGNGFLYNMVRIMAGTLLYVGLGKIKPEDVKTIIEQKDRRNAGKTMPPQGLTLVKIEY